MDNSKSIQELIEKIEVDKELLTTMPKNNEKNIEKYSKKINEIQQGYESQKNEILTILNKRYNKGIDIKENPEINELEVRLKTIENILYLLNEKTTSYEKMELDRIIYKLRKYYKENLEIVNEQIAIVINKFLMIGIRLDITDFDYSIYVKQYMEVFLEEYKNKTLSSENLKNKFEEIYWKCPDIIVHIELNIRNLYLKNQNQIDKYFLKQKEELLKKWDKTPNEIIKIYFQLVIAQQEKVSTDKNIILNKFLDGTLNAKNYKTEKITSDFQKILPENIIENLQENKQEIKQNISKFLYSLYEYKNVEEFRFIIDDIKTCYQEKEKYKNIYDETKKKIDASEKVLKKLNKKQEAGGWFGKKATTTGISTEQSALFLELKNSYRKLDLDRFYSKMYSCITDDTTLFETLELATSYYEYITQCIIKNDQTITQIDIDKKIDKLKRFLINPYNTIINNMTIMQDKDIGTIIKDRYKLLNFNVEKEDLQIDNVDNLISLLEEIQQKFNIEETELDINNIEELVELKKLLKK